MGPVPGNVERTGGVRAILKNLIIVSLIALVLVVAIDNQRLERRNQRLCRAIQEVIYNNSHHIPGYIEPSDVIKGIYIRRLIK